MKNAISLLIKIHLLTLLLLLAGIFAYAQDKLYDNEFPLGDVKLLDGILKDARDLNIKTLLQYDCDRLLAPIRKEAGLEPKAPLYPNWAGLVHLLRHPHGECGTVGSADRRAAAVVSSLKAKTGTCSVTIQGALRS